MKHTRSALRGIRFWAAPLILLFFAGSGRALDQIRFVTNYTHGVIDDVGDADIVATTRADGMAEYQKLKEMYPNPQALERVLSRTAIRGVLRDLRFSFEDDSKTLKITGRRLGAASRRRTRWEFQADHPYEPLHIGGRTVILAHTLVASPDTVSTDLLKITLPERARDVRYDKARRVLSYILDREPAAGAPAVDCDFEVRRAIMSGMYKIYGQPEVANGLMWVGRAVVRNDGDGDASDVRIRYRTGELSGWSPDSRYDLLPSGGTIVDCYYPIYSASAMDIDDAMPVEVEVNVRYRDAAGAPHEETYGERAAVLGRRAFEFSFIPDSERLQWADHYLNAILLPAFVTKNDPVIREFASMAARNEGIGALTDDATAMAYCRLVYNQLVGNGIVCRNPSGFLTESGGGLIDFKYPRDVLREKYGNSLEIAALFAAVCAANGLDTGLRLAPGVCAVVVRLPSGNLFPLELSGLTARAPRSFDDASGLGRQIGANAQPSGHILVDVRAGQSGGIVPPELPALPQGTLAEWGIAYRDAPAGSGETARHAAPDAGGGLVGRWRHAGADAAIVFVIERDGDRFAGKCLMDERDPDAVMPIVHCEIDRDRVRLVARVSWKSGDQDCFVSYLFAGRLRDDELTGLFSIRMRRPGEDARETPDTEMTFSRVR